MHVIHEWRYKTGCLHIVFHCCRRQFQKQIAMYSIVSCVVITCPLFRLIFLILSSILKQWPANCKNMKLGRCCISCGVRLCLCSLHLHNTLKHLRWCDEWMKMKWKNKKNVSSFNSKLHQKYHLNVEMCYIFVCSMQ